MSKLTLLQTGKNFKLYKDENDNPFILLQNVRFSYPFIGTPSDDENDDGQSVKKWRVVGMLPKSTHMEAKDACKKIILKLIADNSAKVPQDKWFLANGDDKEDELMHDHFLITASDGRIRPKARNASGQIIDEVTEIDSTFYGGCWGHMLIRPWYFGGKAKNSSKTFPKRVSAGLNSVMFWKDDKPFGSGRVDDNGVFGDEDDGMGGESDDDTSGL
jgi:hypothetical protein